MFIGQCGIKNNILRFFLASLNFISLSIHVNSMANQIKNNHCQLNERMSVN